jgi:hypothetical protein
MLQAVPETYVSVLFTASFLLSQIETPTALKDGDISHAVKFRRLCG